MTVLISLFSAGREILSVLQMVKKDRLLFAALMYTISIILDALRTKLLSKVAKTKIKYPKCVENTLLGLYTSAITPFSMGGQPFQIYHLFKMGMSLESASMVVGIKFITSFTTTLGLVFFFLLLYGKKLISTTASSLIIYGGMVLTVSMYMFFLLLILNKDLTHRIFTSKFMVKILSIILRKRKEQVLQKAVQSVSKYFELINQLWKQSKKTVFLNIVITLGEIFLVHTVPYVVATSLSSLRISYPQFFGAIITMTVVVYFVPTPGSSGGVEAAFYMMFRNMCSPAVVSATILLWRFLTFHLVILIGTILLSKTIYEIKSRVQSKETNQT